VVVLAGASAAPVTDSAGTSDDGRARAVLREQQPGVSEVDETAGAELAAATSGALFDTAPVVVLGPHDDDAGMQRAGRVAAGLGVPVLPASGGPDGPVADELAELSPRAVLTAGGVTTGEVETLVADQQVITADGAASDGLPAEVPDTQRPRPLKATVLVSDDGSAGAAVATARSAGARVLSVDGADPRADGDVVETLRERAPDTVVALGAEFAPVQRFRDRLAVAQTGEQLPGGGQRMFPGRRLVALYGHPGTSDLGALGAQGIDDS